MQRRIDCLTECGDPIHIVELPPLPALHAVLIVTYDDIAVDVIEFSLN